jgi:hypothetical protein
MTFYLKGLAGLVGGAVVGLILTLGLVVARAQLDGAYFHDPDELISWVGIPLAAGPLVGAWIGAAHPPGRSVMVWSAFGLVVGILVGAILGSAVTDDPSGPWAGMVMGAAAGVLAGAWTALFRFYRRRRRHLDLGLDPHPPRPIVASLLLTALLLGPLVLLVARVSDPSPPEAAHVEPEPDSSAVESVILLIGDAGDARQATSPLLARVHREVERWASLIERDSAVVVLVLGDIVYPAGVGAPDSPSRAEDSARVADQAFLVADSVSRARGARALFVAGNHDWGQSRDLEGALQVEHLGDLLDTLRASGPAVALLPPAGSGGPGVVDVGQHLRLVLLDTAWWLLEADGDERRAVLDGVAQALETAGAREIVIAAHHPFDSGGPHGGLASVSRSLGVQALLSRSGALLQDLTSRPYRELRSGLLTVFAAQGPPALFAGGHEHSMQLVRSVVEHGPRLNVVSGAASKLTPVGTRPGMLFARSEPGFARLLVMTDGSLHLSLVTAPAEYLACPDADAERVACMAEGARAFRTVWSMGM